MSFDSKRQGMAERLKEQDKRQGFSIWKLIDPLFWVSYSFSYFLLSPKYKLTKFEIAFIMDNIQKHRIVLWVNFIGGMIAFYALADNSQEQLNSIVLLLMVPIFVTGSAWFMISFGGVPTKLLDVALIITFWIFSAFTLSLTTMLIVAYYILEGEMFIQIVILFIYICIILSAIIYDDLDGLKIGLDETLKDNSEATLRYLKKYYNITPPAEGDKLYDNLNQDDDK